MLNYQRVFVPNLWRTYHGMSWYVMDCHGICLQNDLNDLKLEGIFEGIEYAQMTPMDLCVFGVLATKSTRQRGRN